MDWAFRFNPDGLSRQTTRSLVHGLQWAQSFGTSSVLRVDLRHNSFDYRDRVYDRIYSVVNGVLVLDPRYEAAGPPRGDDTYEYEAIVQGVQNANFIQNTNAYVIGGSWTHHLSRDHQFKSGIEWQPTRVIFGNPGHIVVSGDRFVLHVNERPDYPDPQKYLPVLGTIYAQDDLEWNDLRFRARPPLRVLQPARGRAVAICPNPANVIDGAPPSPLRATTRKLTLAPRIGVSYPVTKNSSLFFAYGHFYQMPPLGDVFRNADYAVLANLQADGIDFGVLGNPDIKPERTIQYQFGYKHASREWLGLDVTHVLQGHPRPARRGDPHDLQQRRVRGGSATPTSGA